MDETYNIIQLLNKDNIKPRTIVDYQRTTGNFQPSKPQIKRNVKAEVSIKDYYIKETIQPSVNPDAFLKYKINKRSSQNLKFENKSKQQLLNDLKTGNSNYANEYVHYMPSYMKSKDPILKNNSQVSAAFSSGVPEAPKELPYDTLTQQGLEERNDADEALVERFIAAREKHNNKLNNSNYEADNDSNVKQQIEENIKRGNTDNIQRENAAASKLQAIRKGSKERQEYEKIIETKNKAAGKIQQISRKKLIGVTKATLEKKETQTSQPLEVISEPKPPIASSSKETKDDEDSDSNETDLADDPDNLKLFLESIKSYGVEQEDLDKILFKGGGNTRKRQYLILQQLAKNLYQQNRSKEFLNKTTDKLTSGGQHKIKTVSELNKILEELKKK